MTDNASFFQYASSSWILGRASFNCISQPDESFQRLPSPPVSSQVPTPRTTFTETPLFEVCSAKVGPPYFAFHQLSKRTRHHFRGALHSNLNNECIVIAVCKPRNSSCSEYLVRAPLSDSRIILTFAARVLIACLRSVTTTASGGVQNAG